MAIARPIRPARPAAPRPAADPVARWRAGAAAALPALYILPLLFVLQVGAVGPVLFMAALALSFAPVAAVPAGRLARAWPVFLVAGFAVLSTSWSAAPWVTLRLSVQLALTVLAGAVLGASERPRRTLVGVWATFAAYAAASLLLGGSVRMGPAQDTAFAGLNSSKNYLADIVSIGLLAGAATLPWALRERRVVLAALVAGALAVEALILYLARSSGAVLGVGVGLAVLAAMLLLGRARGGLKALALASLLVVAGVGGAAATLEGPAVRDGLLQAMGKNDTLTGRVYLWCRAEAIMRGRPWLGTGFGAFWVQGQVDAEGLWAYGGIRDRAGFNFHNAAVEQRVNLGWVGFLLIGAVTLAGAAALAVRSLGAPSGVDAFWTALMAYELSRVGYEAVGPAPFNMGTVMIAAALTFAATPAGTGRRGRPALRRPAGRPRPAGAPDGLPG